jgi:hypothetical protein
MTIFRLAELREQALRVDGAQAGLVAWRGELGVPGGAVTSQIERGTHWFWLVVS